MTQSHLHLKPLSPIFMWVGGKRSEMKKYIQYIPDDIDIYLEPFVGGGATYFHLNHKKNVISDVHTELTDFYQCLKEDKNGRHLYIYDNTIQ